MSSIYKILINPFYAGLIPWGDRTYPWKHQAIVTLDEFERVRALLRRRGTARPQKHTFAFTGMIRCGSCGLSVTAEHKVNPFGSRYIYYHCTKRRFEARCAEPCVELKSLERQIDIFLRSLSVPLQLLEWSVDRIRNGSKDGELEARKRSLERAKEDAGSQLRELTGLRLRNLITDEEFLARRRDLQHEELRFAEKIGATQNERDWFEPFQMVISFRNCAADWFLRGGIPEKRLILETVGSNLTLTNKILNIQATKPFLQTPDLEGCLYQLADVEDVRTRKRKGKERPNEKSLSRFQQKLLSDIQNDPQRDHILGNISRLQQMFDPAAKEHRKAA